MRILVLKTLLIMLHFLWLPLYAESSLGAQPRVLFLGDSHGVGPFGRKLDELLRAEGFAVYTSASCGSTLKDWFSGKVTTCGFFGRDLKGIVYEAKQSKTPNFNYLMQKVRPDILMIEMGANYQFYHNEEEIKKEIEAVLKSIVFKVQRCIWVTYPDSRKYRSQRESLAKILDEVVTPYCDIFRSYNVTQYPATGGDGVHYSFGEAIPRAQQWAVEVFNKYFKSN